MAAVVADASPLIALRQLDHLELLERLFAEVTIPPVVAEEVRPSLPVLPAWIRDRVVICDALASWYAWIAYQWRPELSS